MTCNDIAWWRHQMEAFSALLAICAGNSPVPGEFLAQRPVTRSFDVFFDLRLNKRLSKQSWGWRFETLSRPLWRYCNVSSRRSSPDRYDRRDGGGLTDLSLDKMAAISQTVFADVFFVYEKSCISIKISLKFVPKGSIDKNPALV